MSYRWYQIPGRVGLLVAALVRSVWADWFPRRCCRTCEWSRAKGLRTLDCRFGLGDGYGRVVWPDGVCEHWTKKHIAKE